MKKLSLLIALMLCVTITGVYAVWTYAGTNDIADAYAEAKITIADVELVGANGTYHITSNLVLTIDQANTDHEAKLVFASNDAQPIYLRVTFDPADNAGQDIKDHAVPSELYFGTTTVMQYKMDNAGNYSAEGTPTPILTFANPGDGELNNLIVWGDPDPETGIFTFEMDEDDLKAAISLSTNFVLDTKAEHDAFREALTGNVVARVTDGIVTNDAPAVNP